MRIKTPKDYPMDRSVLAPLWYAGLFAIGALAGGVGYLIGRWIFS